MKSLEGIEVLAHEFLNSDEVSPMDEMEKVMLILCIAMGTAMKDEIVNEFNQIKGAYLLALHEEEKDG